MRSSLFGITPSSWLAFLFAVGASAPCALSAEGDEIVRAQLTPRRYALIASEISAKISHVHVSEGGAFKAGEPLLSFDSTLQKAQVERAEAVLSAAEKTAAANQRLVTLQAVGQVEVALSEAEVRKARAELAFAGAMVAKCQINAPFSGRVAEQRVREQEFVQPGQALIEIIDDALPQIDFIAPSKWLAWLRVGQTLQLRVDETDKTYEAKIERIGAKVDPVSQSVKIVAGLSGEHPELMAGMSGSVVITAEDRH